MVYQSIWGNFWSFLAGALAKQFGAHCQRKGTCGIISPALFSQSEHAPDLGNFSSGCNSFCFLSLDAKNLEEKEKSKLTAAHEFYLTHCK
jgi:hypothetical protein